MANPSPEAKISEPQIDQYQAFHHSLDVTRFKTELDSLRRQKNSDKTSKEEYKAAKLIQTETLKFPTCSLITTELLFQESTISYLKADNSDQRFHSLILVTANETLELLGQKKRAGIITNDTLQGQSITTTDILNVNNGTIDNLTINLRGLHLNISKPDELNSQVLYNIAQILERERSDEACIKIRRKLVKMFPEESDNHVKLGTLLILNYYFSEAKEKSRQAIKIFPNNPGLYNILGYALAGAPDSPFFEEAIEAFKQFITLATKDEYWKGYIHKIEAEITYLEKQSATNKIKMGFYTQEIERRRAVIEISQDPNYHNRTSSPKPDLTPNSKPEEG